MLPYIPACMLQCLYQHTHCLSIFVHVYSCCWYAGDGEVFAFGWNKNGQLGVPPSEDMTVPHPLARTLSHCATKIAKVSCGWNHTLAIGDGGSLIVWGSNAFGQLGAPDVAKQTDRPIVLQQEVFSNSRILDISAGLRHSMAVTGRISTCILTYSGLHANLCASVWMEGKVS